MSDQKKPMRTAMPTVTAFIDSLKDVFGAQAIESAIKDGIKAGTFYAQENGHEVGVKPAPDLARVVAGKDVMTGSNESLRMAAKSKVKNGSN